MVFKKQFSSLHKSIYVNFITRDKLAILSQGNDKRRKKAFEIMFLYIFSAIIVNPINRGDTNK